MARFLLQSHAPTTGLAHLGTAIAIARALRDRGEDPILAYGGRRGDLIDAAGLERIAVEEIAPEREWDAGDWFDGRADLERVVYSHLTAIERTGPDAVIACHGLAGRLAAEIAGVRSIHAFHYLQATAYARRLAVFRARRRDLLRPRRAFRVGRARLRSMRKPRGAGDRAAVAELRAAHGLPVARPGAIAGVEDALVAISTTPFLIPAVGLPPHWRYVGPIHFTPPAPEPEAPEGEGPIAYLTQGSTGRADLLRRSRDELLAAGFRVIATTADLLDPAELADPDGRVVAEPLLDGGACMRMAEVAVFHGGHQTLLDAVAAGTPLVSIPTRADQIGQLHRIADLGIGRTLYPPPLFRGAIARAARAAMRPAVRRRCRALAEQLDGDWDGAANVAALAAGLARGEDPLELADAGVGAGE